MIFLIIGIGIVFLLIFIVLMVNSIYTGFNNKKAIKNGVEGICTVSLISISGKQYPLFKFMLHPLSYKLKVRYKVEGNIYERIIYTPGVTTNELPKDYFNTHHKIPILYLESNPKFVIANIPVLIKKQEKASVFLIILGLLLLVGVLIFFLFFIVTLI